MEFVATTIRSEANRRLQDVFVDTLGVSKRRACTELIDKAMAGYPAMSGRSSSPLLNSQLIEKRDQCVLSLREIFRAFEKPDGQEVECLLDPLAYNMACVVVEYTMEG